MLKGRKSLINRNVLLIDGRRTMAVASSIRWNGRRRCFIQFLLTKSCTTKLCLFWERNVSTFWSGGFVYEF